MSDSALDSSIRTIYLGKRGIVKESVYYKIYLPKSLNDLWHKLRGKKVKVYLVINE